MYRSFRRWTTREVSTATWDDKTLIREELFSAERLEAHAISLAQAQTVAHIRSGRSRQLSRRLKQNGAALYVTFNAIGRALAGGGAITPAAEWLLDNYHLVERQIRQIGSDLPEGYYRQLPKLADGPLAGYPRVLGIAWAIVAHGDSTFNRDMLVRCLNAYQSVQPLTIGELWAIPITLRIVLIENLRRVGDAIVRDRKLRRAADDVADRLLGTHGRTAEPAQALFAEQGDEPLADAFCVQLVHRLRDEDPNSTPALAWLNERLAARGTDAEAIVRQVQRSQGTANVTVRNVFTSLKLIADTDWPDLIESVSLVDRVLDDDASFSAMDFSTRDLYRAAVADIARGSGQSELAVAEAAMRAARKARDSDADVRQADPGFHLIAGGRRAFERELGFFSKAHRFDASLRRNFGILAYAGTIMAMTGLVLAAPLLALMAAGVGASAVAAIGILGLIPASSAAMALVNRAINAVFGAVPLPALELKQGIPPDRRTLIAVPVLLNGKKMTDELIQRLEVHHLANPGDNLHFALLSDWPDAAEETTPDDFDWLEDARAGIERLNQRYAPLANGPRFLLFHRRRLWNASEGVWMGWERKRGKLHELNRLLRGASDTSFDGHEVVPEGIRYVVTLDADTRLPRDAVRRLVGKMAHPLNEARLDPASRRVVEGYGILQPRVTPSLPTGGEGSIFQRTFSSMSGIDPYGSAISDVYQDIAGEGSYAGKGIYDVDAYEAAMAGRVPDNSLLSHDLFEGIFARSGLASDVEVVEDFPARYEVAASRRHRWARGDWQLLPWILGLSRSGRDGASAENTIPKIGRWKMLDNLRRSLDAPVSFASLLIAWQLPLQPAALWTSFIIATLLLPAVLPAMGRILTKRTGVKLRNHMRGLGDEFATGLIQAALSIVFLAADAILMTDAIVRTLWRLLVSRRHLLEWVPAAQAAETAAHGMLDSYRRMGMPAIAGALVVILAAFGYFSAQPLAMLFGLIWIGSPAIAHLVSLGPPGDGLPAIAAQDAASLRQIARRTWRFFEEFVTASENWLPPDNFQETPTPVVAHRTSPTNIGLYLLAVASARAFGWISTSIAATRIENTLNTLDRMQHHRGHLLNWYDTQDLRPLEPRYVSTVDSGNLAGHLLATASLLDDWRRHGALDRREALGGVADALELARGNLASPAESLPALSDGWAETAERLTRLIEHLRCDTPEEGALGADLDGHIAAIEDLLAASAAEGRPFARDDVREALAAARLCLADHAADAGSAPALEPRLARLAERCRAMALAMDFKFLVDRERILFSIGYLVAEDRLDASCYDLLASEARLASFFAIAKGDVPTKHWFRLGRPVTPIGFGAALVSWSGSMFEYLMPSLVMRAPRGSLLEHSNRLIVRRQIAHGASLGIPWGISESAYNTRDLEKTYQYSNFGVPGLGLKRGLADNQVVAPYATALAAMIEPAAATANFARFAALGAVGRFGLFEAVDFTPTRLPEEASFAIVRCFMAHHQGMTIVALANVLLAGTFRTHFHAEPMIEATELLLQEATPRDVAFERPWRIEFKSSTRSGLSTQSGERVFTSARQVTPATILLSNGRLSTLLTTAGSGHIRWGDFAVTRWRADATLNDHGPSLHVRDVETGEIWTAGSPFPTSDGAIFRAVFQEDHAEVTRRAGAFETTLDVLISSDDDAEARRITFNNRSRRVREVDVTSYVELALAPQNADIAHPAFSKLFVVTDRVGDALTATRRRRSPDEAPIHVAHLCVVEGEAIGDLEFETDRAKLVERGSPRAIPKRIASGERLSGSHGTVLDPAFALRRRIRIAPGMTRRITFWTLVAETPEALIDSIDRHSDKAAYTRAATLAWTQAQVELYHLGITPAAAALFQDMARFLVFPSTLLRPPSAVIRQGLQRQSALWANGISGDRPIVLLKITELDTVEVARDLMKAREYWRMKRLDFDVVILNERRGSYMQDLQAALETMVRTSLSQPLAGRDNVRGGLIVLRSDLLSQDYCALLTAVACVVLVADRGTIAEQLGRLNREAAPLAIPYRPASIPDAPAPLPTLEFFNGLGGFADEGRTYVTRLNPGQSTPAPWINVIANESFGFQVSVEGGGYTWSLNSRERKLTPWSNDPVADRSGEIFYIRDEVSRTVWSPTAVPSRHPDGVYTATHGRGFSRFDHAANGISASLTQFVPIEGAIKISRLTLTNRSDRARRLSVTGYVEWVLGTDRAATVPFVVTECDEATGAILATNPWSIDFPNRTAFLASSHPATDWTGDRSEFLGLNGREDAPAALMGSAPLSRRTGAGFDPCAALRQLVDIAPYGTAEVVFFLGDAATRTEARSLITETRGANLNDLMRAARSAWDTTLEAVTVRTPDRAMDLMLNGWLLYQTIACRIRARSAFYQSSGAYGFRDQLQDNMALAAIDPEATRRHILRAAGRQFVEGDVQHWWLPHSGQGVRTRFADDRVWLAFATAHYVETAGDPAVLDMVIPFLGGQRLLDGEHEAFFPPTESDSVATVYEHCARALDASLAFGPHGLPLFGGGDWNDGMNRVGIGGTGESLWLGWFLIATLQAFAPLASARGDGERAQRWREAATAIAANMEENGWDGAWYRRGYFDDGSPLGAAQNAQCRIDSIAQSWSVLSGGAEPSRAATAIASVERELHRKASGVALLFTPPFDAASPDPGYVQAYPPGIRENGGQYTHAALWTVLALAKLGEGDKAASLFAMLNPINHARTPAEVVRYKVEPYVVAADIYSVAPHEGRGGWSWYTGSAAWMQRAGIEGLLGLTVHGADLMVEPCIPRIWPGYTITVRRGAARYVITVENPDSVSGGVAAASLDGVDMIARPLRFAAPDDGQSHSVTIRLGAAG